MPANELLRRYLAVPAPPDEDPEDLLAQLVIGFGQPVIENVVRRRLESTHDVEDVSSEAILALLTRLRTLRADQSSGPVTDFESYAAGIASHVVFRFFAARSPELSRLRTRLRYLLTTDSRFQLRQGLCALTDGGATPRRGPALADAAIETLSSASGPLEFGNLAAMCGARLGIADPRQTPGEWAESLADNRAAHSHDVELRDYLRALWNEILTLPIPQRQALLLNLRSSSGAGIWLFTDLSIAGFSELASCLDLNPHDLALLWNRLPLDDNEIATRSGLSRQQVINLRSAARQRLTRRMAISAPIRRLSE